MKEEMILVVRRSLLESLGVFQGFTQEVDRYLPTLLARENNFFAARSTAENDPSLKQIIPYALISGQGKVLRYKRGKASGEKRLVAKASIGIGGHMNDQDEGLFALDRAAYLAGVQREIDEEIGIPNPRSTGHPGSAPDDRWMTRSDRAAAGGHSRQRAPLPPRTRSSCQPGMRSCFRPASL